MDTNDYLMPGIQLKKMVIKKTAPIIEKYSLRPVELDILVLLQREKNIDTAKAIVQRRHFSKAHISKSLENLCEKGFIQIREENEDHRILHIVLTEQAKDIVEQMLQIYGECRDIVRQGISEEELQNVKIVLNKINDNINRELGES